MLTSWDVLVLVSKVVLTPKVVRASKVRLWWVWFPSKIWMIPLIGIVGVTKLVIVVHNICLFRELVREGQESGTL